MERFGPELVGYEGKRKLYALALNSPDDLPAEIELGVPRFICLVAWNAEGVPIDVIARLARKLLNCGGVYVCAWGTACERVHDIFDEVSLEAAPRSDGDAVVMTTWHADKPLSEAIWFSLFSAWPDDGCSNGCDAILGLSIGSEAFDSEIQSAFADPAAFSAAVLGE